MVATTRVTYVLSVGKLFQQWVFLFLMSLMQHAQLKDVSHLAEDALQSIFCSLPSAFTAQCLDQSWV